ncbi:MAG TPA: hypothetical protein VJZ03_04535 [Candidatus Bathyarchaeia archaeon]|nr:hypothetical protein [Candidatus Bathyarchaeia archaeon]
MKKVVFILLVVAAGILAIASVPLLTNHLGQSGNFNLVEYCSRYREQFNVTYCPAEATKPTIFSSLMDMPFEVLGIGIALTLLLSGFAITVVERRRLVAS